MAPYGVLLIVFIPKELFVVVVVVVDDVVVNCGGVIVVLLFSSKLLLEFEVAGIVRMCETIERRSYTSFKKQPDSSEYSFLKNLFKIKNHQHYQDQYCSD